MGRGCALAEIFLAPSFGLFWIHHCIGDISLKVLCFGRCHILLPFNMVDFGPCDQYLAVLQKAYCRAFNKISVRYVAALYGTDRRTR